MDNFIINEDEDEDEYEDEDVEESEVKQIDDDPRSKESSDLEDLSGVRRSARATAGQTNKYDDYELAGFTTGLTRGYGLALANLSVKVALEEFGKKAYTAIRDELTQLFITKRALKALSWKEINVKAKEMSVVASHMFLREKFDSNGNFEKMKARLVADGRMQDKTDFKIEDISSPTAKLESIINVLKIVVEEDRHTLVIDVGGAYLNAKIDRTTFMYL